MHSDNSGSENGPESLRDLPEDVHDIADAISVETAQPDQQRRMVSKTCDAVTQAQTAPRQEATVKLAKQVVEKVGQEGIDQVQEQIDGFLDEIEAELTPEFQDRLVNARLLHKVISFPPPATSVAIGRNAATREGMDKAVEAVVHLDEGKGVKRSQVQKHLGQSTTKVANLLKGCVEAGAVRCTKSGPGSASLYHPIESEAPDPSTDPSSEPRSGMGTPVCEANQEAI